MKYFIIYTEATETWERQYIFMTQIKMRRPYCFDFAELVKQSEFLEGFFS